MTKKGEQMKLEDMFYGLELSGLSLRLVRVKEAIRLTRQEGKIALTEINRSRFSRLLDFLQSLYQLGEELDNGIIKNELNTDFIRIYNLLIESCWEENMPEIMNAINSCQILAAGHCVTSENLEKLSQIINDFYLKSINAARLATYSDK